MRQISVLIVSVSQFTRCMFNFWSAILINLWLLTNICLKDRGCHRGKLYNYNIDWARLHTLHAKAVYYCSCSNVGLVTLLLGLLYLNCAQLLFMEGVEVRGINKLAVVLAPSCIFSMWYYFLDDTIEIGSLGSVGDNCFRWVATEIPYHFNADLSSFIFPGSNIGINWTR